MPDVVTFYPRNALIIPPGEVTETPAPCGVIQSDERELTVSAHSMNPADRPLSSPTVVLIR